MHEYSLRSVTLISSVLARAGQKGQQRRLEAAAHGSATWEPTPDVKKFMRREAMEKMAKAAEQRQSEEARFSEATDESIHDELRRSLGL